MLQDARCRYECRAPLCASPREFRQNMKLRYFRCVRCDAISYFRLFFSAFLRFHISDILMPSLITAFFLLRRRFAAEIFAAPL